MRWRLRVDGQKIRVRVDRGPTARMDLKVQVRRAVTCVTGVSDRPDHLSDRDGGADLDPFRDAGEVGKVVLVALRVPEPDPDATQARLDRGRRMVEILKQGQYQPLNVIDQILIIFAGTRGHLDKIPRTEVAAWEKQFLLFMRDQKPEIGKKIAETKDLDDTAMKSVTDAITEFQKQYAAKREATARA